MLKIFYIFFIVYFSFQSLLANEYFLTLRNDKVNLRQGPSFEYPIKLFYKKKFLPVLIQDKFENFRKIKDHENNTGWIHISQLSKKKAAITIDDDQLIFNKPSIYSKPFAILKKGRLCKIHKCKDEWCKISVEKYKGWVKKRYFVGSIINYFLYLAVQILSRTKYQIALANGSTIASVRATIKDTSAINIKTVMAIAK